MAVSPVAGAATAVLAVCPDQSALSDVASDVDEVISSGRRTEPAMAWRDIASENEDRRMRSGGRGSNKYLTHGMQVCDIKFELIHRALRSTGRL